MSVALALMGAKGAANILGGISSSKKAGSIAKAQRQSAGLQYEYNKKEIERSFQDNFINTMSQYVGARAELISEATKTAADLRTQLSMDNGADTEMNSYRTDSFNKLDSEFMENMTSLITEQVYQVKELANERESQKYQAGMMHSNAMSGINNMEYQANQQANQQIIQGAFDIGSAGLSKYGNNTDKAKSEMKTIGLKDISNFGTSSFYKPTKLTTSFIPNADLMGRG